jgi:hypothetical protein
MGIEPVKGPLLLRPIVGAASEGSNVGFPEYDKAFHFVFARRGIDVDADIPVEP